MPFGIQPWHIIVIVVVALILFGPSKLPELGRSIGRSITEFRRGTHEMTESFKAEIAQPDEPAQPAIPMQNTPVQTVASPPPAPVPVPAPAAYQPAAAATNTSEPPTPGGNFCTNCGAPNAPAARFCNNCGAQIRA